MQIRRSLPHLQPLLPSRVRIPLQHSRFLPATGRPASGLFDKSLKNLHAGKTIRDEELEILDRLENWPRVFATAAQKAEVVDCGEEADQTRESIGPEHIAAIDPPTALATWICPHEFGLFPVLESLSLVSIEISGRLNDA